MKDLFLKIEKTINSPKKKIIDKRLKELKKNSKTKESVFSELCFCIMTANFQAKKSIDIQNNYSSLFENSKYDDLKKILKDAGHRFWEQRAKRIVEARDKKDLLFENLDRENIRDFIVDNFNGIGMKESSHFLRNIGKFDYAIIDFHIIDLLVKEGITERPKTLTKKRYLEIENDLRKIANHFNMSLGELDLYLWYIETGSVLK
jgi:N-glycosylase/DNA lyase